jgi:LacI family transcriptional regulator
MSADNRNQRRVTMSDVALAANVHKSTVSLALRNQSRLSAATRERIRRIAEELGYRPDPMLGLFNLHRSSLAPPRPAGTIAFVSDLPTPAAFARSERHETIFSSAREEARRLNFTLELFLLGPAQLSAARLSQVLLARGITGILLGALSPATRSLNIDWSQFCVVGIESAHVEPRVDNVSTNYCQAARLAVRRLGERGRRNAGFIVAQDLGVEIDRQLRAGYLVESRKIGTAVRVAPFWRVSTDAAGSESLQQWIRAEALDAVVVSGVGISSLVAGVDPALARSVAWASIDIHCDQSGTSYACVPALHRDLGRRAVGVLASRIQVNLRGVPPNPSTTFFPVEWRENGSA